MNNRLASRFAQSFLDLAQEQNLMDAASQDAELVAGVISENRDLLSMLKSPVVKADKKSKILHLIFENKVSSLTMSFLALITRKNREPLMPDILQETIKQYKERKGIVTAEVVTAFPLSPALRDQIEKKIKEVSPKMDIVEKVDPNIIGGIVIRIGDRQVDSSITRQLADLRKEFQRPVYN
jgi:F-type H+-transporting ATPase subunit delta